ncbi:MAG TPA: hypothetical protein VLA84_12780 [Microcoleus sp.]|nr:hypothetical protein [Microcoleus sp.]
MNGWVERTGSDRLSLIIVSFNIGPMLREVKTRSLAFQTNLNILIILFEATVSLQSNAVL